MADRDARLTWIIIFGAVLLTWGLVGLTWLAGRQDRWLAALQRDVVVGMTRDDVLQRMGRPDAVHAPGSDEWRRGFTHLERPIEHELLTWTIFDPAHAACRLFVYVDEGGMVTCVYIGTT